MKCLVLDNYLDISIRQNLHYKEDTFMQHLILTVLWRVQQTIGPLFILFKPSSEQFQKLKKIKDTIDTQKETQ